MYSDIFEDINTEEKAYWLGFIIADGSVGKHPNYDSHYLKISLKESDKEHLEKFKKFMGSSNTVKVYSSNNYRSCEFKITSKKLVKDLEKFGVIRNKTFNAYVPNINKELIKHLLRGIWDGDGSVLYRQRSKKYPNNIRPEVQLCGNTNILNEAQKYFLDELNVQPSKLTKTGSIYLFRKTCGPAKSIIEHLYKDSNIALSRKLTVANKCLKWLPKKKSN